MKKFLLIFFIATNYYYSQGISGTSAKYEYRFLVDMPTAGVINKGFSSATFEMMPYGVLITKIEVGVLERFSFGISYGGSNIIGTGKIDFYKLPGLNVKFRFLDETILLPAFALGFDSQGKGIFDKKLNRYEIKSPGIFLAASKNYELLGYLSLHSVINYSLERDDNDKDLNLAFGFEKTIGEFISFVGEYNIALNDNKSISFGKGNGYLNFGFRFDIADGLTLGLDFRDLIQNKKINTNIADRGIFIQYIKGIF
ncbi:MAG: YjbH domain-containing protein [Melioribacteraceae bacterium]|nr:YjbH domain-containing protein [Melioribacteraceae bacterium]